MSPVYLNYPQHSSTIPFIELKGDHQHNLPIIMGYVHDHVTSSNTNNNTYFSRSSFDNNNNTSNEYPVVDYSRRTQERVIDQKLILSHDKPIVYPFNNHGDNNNTNNNNNSNNNINKIIKIDQKPKKCKQSKERIIQKASTTTVKSKRMIIGDHNLNYDHGNYNLHAQVKQSNMYYHKSRNEIIKKNNNNFIRTCTDCHTTTTPLWRSGPQGPKSLCNACGIRQRKARRAAAAAAAAAMAPMDDDAPLPSPISSTTTTTTTTTTPTTSPKLTLEVEEVKSPKNLDHETIIMTHTLPLKKRSKTFNDHTSWNYNNSASNNNNINSSNNDNDNDNMDNNNNNDDDYSSRPSNYSTQRVFPKDEEEGAILLMALSCGLACSS